MNHRGVFVLFGLVFLNVQMNSFHMTKTKKQKNNPGEQIIFLNTGCENVTAKSNIWPAIWPEEKPVSKKVILSYVLLFYPKLMSESIPMYF